MTLALIAVIGVLFVLSMGAWHLLKEQGECIRELREDNRRLVESLCAKAGEPVVLTHQERAENILRNPPKRSVPYWTSKDPTFDTVVNRQ